MINGQYLAVFADDTKVKALARRILSEGCVVLPDFFVPETVEKLLDYSRSLPKDNQRFAISRQAGTLAMNVARSKEFMRVFDSLHKARCEIEGTEYKSLDPTQQAVSLPIAGVGKVDPVPFHYDHSFINAVFAMKMPDKSTEGNLLVYNGLRNRIRPHLLCQVVSRMLRHSSLLRTLFPPKEIQYKQGALHIFFGDITLHGVRAISAGERVTFTINASRVYRAPEERDVPVAA